jgi:hypothetical protein
MRRQHLQLPSLFRLKKLVAGCSKDVELLQRQSDVHQRGYLVPPLESTVHKKFKIQRIYV